MVVHFSCKKGELFDYLTQVVTLSEKRTRFVNNLLFYLMYYPLYLTL